MRNAILRLIAMCAGGCGTRVPDGQVMCEICAWTSCTPGIAQ